MSDNHGERCPICRTKWKITTFGAKVWKDCLECEDTAENLVAKAKENTPSKKYQGIDWVRRGIQLELDPGWDYYSGTETDTQDDWDDEIPF